MNCLATHLSETLPNSESEELIEALRKFVREEVRIALEEITRDKPGYRRVYFIQAEEGGPIKIGVAQDPPKRLAEIQRTCPQKLRILATVPGGAPRERELHSKFADYRLHGEWFQPSNELHAIIAIAEAVA